MAVNPQDVIDSLPFSAVTEEIRRTTPMFIDVCRQQAASERLYGFVWGANDDVTNLNWRGNTEERLVKSAQVWLDSVRSSELSAEQRTLESALRIQRFHPYYWSVNDESVTPDVRRMLPGEEMNVVWELFSQSFDFDQDGVFGHCRNVKRRLINAIAEGLRQFDGEYHWAGIDRSKFFLSVFVWGGEPELNMAVAKQINTQEVYESFVRCYAPDRSGIP